MPRKPATFAPALPPVPVPDTALWVRGYVSIKHAAEFLDMKPGTVRRLMRNGMLPWKQILSVRRISRVALEALGEEMKGTG